MLSSSTIEPGNTGRIRAVMSTEGKSGRLSKRIRVESDDPTRPFVNLIMTVMVEVKPEDGEGAESTAR